MVKKVPKFDHITDTLIELHWLPVPQRIDYKTLLLVFKALNDLAPKYVRDLVQKKHSTTHALRSNNLNLLATKRTIRATYGDRNFMNVAPRLWNAMPESLRCCDNLTSFKRQLKTHLFKKAYCD